MQQRILVVDDDAGMREMVCDLLSEGGYNVCHASNGSEALQFIEEALYGPMRVPLTGGRCFSFSLEKDRLHRE